MPDDIFERLQLFTGLAPGDLALLRPLFMPCDYYSDTLLFEQGDPADNLYIVIVGEVLVSYKPEDGPPIQVAHVQSGGVVGWSAALGSRRYTSKALCTTYTQLLRVRGTDLRNLCDRHPEIGRVVLERLAAIVAERMKSTHAHVVNLLESGLRGPQTNH